MIKQKNLAETTSNPLQSDKNKNKFNHSHLDLELTRQILPKDRQRHVRQLQLWILVVNGSKRSFKMVLALGHMTMERGLEKIRKPIQWGKRDNKNWAFHQDPDLMSRRKILLRQGLKLWEFLLLRRGIVM